MGTDVGSGRSEAEADKTWIFAVMAAMVEEWASWT